MASSAGTIQFAYELADPNESSPLDPNLVAGLTAWRLILRRSLLIGQQPQRYQGLSYGNLSARPAHSKQDGGGFIITASQSSGAEHLQTQDLVAITHYNLSRLWVDAQGFQPPSADTLVHAMIYASDPRINWVFHVRSEQIWQQTEALGIPAIQAPNDDNTSLATQVAELLQINQSRPLVFTNQTNADKNGNQVFAVAANSRDAGGLLMAYYAKALELSALSSNPLTHETTP